MEEIELELSREQYPLVLRQYGPEGAKKLAIDMCLKQYPGEMTKGNLMSCLSNLESDLGMMFPPVTPEDEEQVRQIMAKWDGVVDTGEGVKDD